MGYDAGKKVKGRKIHALVDTEGLPMRVVVHSAAIQDRDGAGLVLDKIRRRFPWLELIWADGGYNAWQVDAAVAKVPLLRMEIVKRSDDMKGFVVLPRRWVVERTFLLVSTWFEALLHGSVVWRQEGGHCRRAGPSLTADNSPCHSKQTKITVITSRSSATE